MSLKTVLASALVLIALPALAAHWQAEEKLKTLPHADTARLLGSWEVQGMGSASMIYEFRAGQMAMHGKGPSGKSMFEMTMDADYRDAGKDAIWVIGRNPQPMPDDMDPEAANNASIMGVQLTEPDKAILAVAADERFTLVRVH